MNDREAVEFLERLVRIPSPSGSEGLVAAEIAAELARRGFAARIDAAGNPVGALAIGAGGPHVVLLGHIDTVPGAVPVRIERGRLYGRGSVDAKGPFAAFVAAASRLRERRGPPLRITIVGCVEEEAPSSRGARHAVGEHRPDFCVVGEPSGADAVTVGYKGYLRAAVRLRGACRHSAQVVATVPERAVAAWHSIASLAAAFNTGRAQVFDQVLASLVGIASASDGLEARAELDVSLRLPQDLPPEEAERWLKSAAPEAEVEVRGALPAWRGSRGTPLYRAFAGAIRARGAAPRALVKTGTADVNIVAPAWGCPALAYGPGDARLDHTPDEHVELDEFLRGIAVLEDALLCLASEAAAGRATPAAATAPGLPQSR